MRAFPVLNDGSVCFGPSLEPSYKRGKRALDEIVHWGRFDPAWCPSDAQIDEWIRTMRHKAMYRDQSRVD